jgi:hypothetical protein
MSIIILLKQKVIPFVGSFNEFHIFLSNVAQGKKFYSFFISEF